MLEELFQSSFYFLKLVLVKLNNSISNMKHFDSRKSTAGNQSPVLYYICCACIFPTAAKKHLKTTFELSLHEANF